MTRMLRIGEVATALGVSVDTLRRWEADGRLSFVREGRQRMLPASDLVDLLPQAAKTRKTSARNRFSGVVIDVQRDGVMAKVDMVCGEFRVTSLMSRQAADELGLEPGVAATAIVKATTVIVEV